MKPRRGEEETFKRGGGAPLCSRHVFPIRPLQMVLSNSKALPFFFFIFFFFFRSLDFKPLLDLKIFYCLPLIFFFFFFFKIFPFTKARLLRLTSFASFQSHAHFWAPFLLLNPLYNLSLIKIYSFPFQVVSHIFYEFGVTTQRI